MSLFMGRCLLACSLIIVLSACQSAVQHVNDAPVIDEFAVAELVFSTHLAANQLDSAGQQLDDLRSNYPDEPRTADLQQRLANAWLASGEQALKDANVDAASAALIEAKRLLPQAPALTEGLHAAVIAAQAPQVEPLVIAPVAVNKRPVAPKKAVQKQSPMKAKPVPSVVQLEPEQQIPQPAPTPSTAKARIIDVNAPHTIVPLPMLKTRNNHRLGRLLDAVAADVVKFRAAVTIEVADTRDFHWVAALLSARVSKLDGSFKPRLVEVIRSDGPAQLVITPNKI